MIPKIDPKMRDGHVAVPLEHYVLVLGGREKESQPFSYRVIWIYNLYTDAWKRYVILNDKVFPPEYVCACAVTVGHDVYMFGGMDPFEGTYSESLWKLITQSQESFAWNEIIVTSDKKTPSPRMFHTGWEYSGKLWVFGGLGPSPAGYLDDNGDYDGVCNNQLLSFDPSREEWVNQKCFGSVPFPRFGHGATVIGEKVWLCGGRNVNVVFDELYELSMYSLTWTQIQTRETIPKERYFHTLNAVSNSKIVMHGGVVGMDEEPINDTWILDIPSQTWRKYAPGNADSHFFPSGIKGLHSCVFIVGGAEHPSESCNFYSDTFFMMLEPKSLQQLAMKIIYRHKDKLSWNCLPRKLIDQL